jgi:hypothetical protein
MWKESKEPVWLERSKVEEEEENGTRSQAGELEVALT